MFSFKQTDHLKSKKAIEMLFKKGRVLFLFPVKTVWHGTVSFPNGMSGIKAGFTVSKKRHKMAVDRNRVKRILREAYRLHNNDLQNFAKTKNLQIHIMFIYADDKLPLFKDVEEKIIITLNRLKAELLKNDVDKSL
jgi:ribonuclease P protein component